MTTSDIRSHWFDSSGTNIGWDGVAVVVFAVVVAVAAACLIVCLLT